MASDLYNRFLEASGLGGLMWEFPKSRGTLFGVLIIRIPLFRVLY